MIARRGCTHLRLAPHPLELRLSTLGLSLGFVEGVGHGIELRLGLRKLLTEALERFE